MATDFFHIGQRLISLMLILLASPLFVLVGVIIILEDGFPILFFQRRVGKNNEIFTLYKFRTMVGGADRKQQSLRFHNESDGPVFKIHNDPRFTRIGKFLSHTGLDELPQLWNVLRGEMALIGPRPLPVREVAKLKPWMQTRHTVLPGIISPAVLSGNYHSDFDAWMKSDVVYAKEKTTTEDVKLLPTALVFWTTLIARAIKESFSRSRQ